VRPKALVCGAAGFIGSHMVDRLLLEGYSVIGIDDLSSGRLENLENALKSSEFEMRVHDITSPLEIVGNLELVINFASLASPPRYLADPIHTLRSGSIGSENLLRLAHVKDARYVFISTSEVYGDPLVHPQPETYWGNVNPIGIRSCYDEAKRYGEAITSAFRRVYQLDTGILRVFNTYGPRLRLDDGRVISNFLQQASKGGPLTVYGSGSQTRSFCFITDLIEGIWRFSMSTQSGPMNLGNDNEVTVLEVAESMSLIFGIPLEVSHLVLPEDDPRRRKPDIGLARSVLNWTPTVSLEDGIRCTIKSFQENGGI
jgi:dTDP-glucose 4,6-dehydratase